MTDPAPIYEAVVNGDKLDTIDPAISIIIIDNGFHRYEFTPETLQSLVIRVRESQPA